MRIPFPERIPVWHAAAFALALGTLELMQGTETYFCIGVVFFIVLATLAFNTVGGLTRPSGAFILLNAVLTGIIGLTYKAWLGEAAQTNLLNPKMTILVYNVGMAGMLLAAFLSRRFSRREGWLQDSLSLNRMQGAVYGCLGMGVLIALANHFVGGGPLLSAVNQINRFLPMAILLGVTYQIRKSGGRSSLNGAVIFVTLWQFIDGGLLNFSKEAMLTPPFAWLITAASLRFRFSLLQVGGLCLGIFFIFYYLVPYSQYGRNFRDADTTVAAQTTRAIDLLSHLDETRQLNQESEENAREDTIVHYFNAPQGFWDRLQMLGIDDQIIDYTERQRPFGYYPVLFGIENMVPHVIWKDKPTIIFGNLYAHEINLLSADDTTTGVSFSPSAEAWHIGRWLCLLGLTPVVLTIFFITFDSLAGDVRKSPWGLLAIIIFAHAASEGGLSGLLYDLAYGVVGMFFVAFFAAKIMPHLGVLIIGPGRTLERRAVTIQSIPRRDDVL